MALGSSARHGIAQAAQPAAGRVLTGAARGKALIDDRGHELLDDCRELSALVRFEHGKHVVQCVVSSRCRLLCDLPSLSGEPERDRTAVGSGAAFGEPVVDEAIDESNRAGVREVDGVPEVVDRAVVEEVRRARSSAAGAAPTWPVAASVADSMWSARPRTSAPVTLVRWSSTCERLGIEVSLPIERVHMSESYIKRRSR